MRLFAFAFAALGFVVEPARAARDVVDRTGEGLGELPDFDLRRVPVQKLLAPASAEALVLNIEQREEYP